MRKTLIVAGLALAALSQQAQAGLLRDAQRNLEGLGFDMGLRGPPVNGIPAPEVVPIDDSARAYTEWLRRRLPTGAALYNRPCTYSDGVRTHVIACPVQPIIGGDPNVIMAEPAPVYAPAPARHWRHPPLYTRY